MTPSRTTPPVPPRTPPAGASASTVPRGALFVVGTVFVTVMALWFLVLGLVQARG